MNTKGKTYIVALKEPNQAVWALIKQYWSGGRHHFVNETMAIIHPTDPTDTATLSMMLGFDDKSQHTGFVIPLESPLVIAGRFYNDFWEWIRDHG